MMKQSSQEVPAEVLPPSTFKVQKGLEEVPKLGALSVKRGDIDGAATLGTDIVELGREDDEEEVEAAFEEVKL